MFPKTKTEFAQMFVRTVVAMKVAALTKQEIAHHTELDTDGIPVKAAAHVAGFAAAYKAGPYTDHAVETTIEKFKSWREKKQDTTEKA